MNGKMQAKREAMSGASGPKPTGRVGGMVAAVAWWLKTKALAYVVKGLAAALCLGVVFRASFLIGLTIWHYDKIAGEGGEVYLFVPACLFLTGLVLRLNIVSVLALPFCLLLVDGTWSAMHGFRFWPIYFRATIETNLLFSAVILITNVLAWFARFTAAFIHEEISRRRGA